MKRLLLLALVLVLCSACTFPAHAERTYYGTMMVDHCKEWVSLRDGPGTGCRRLAKVPLFALVTDAEWTPICGDFIHCSYNGTEGYILSKYLVPWADPEIEDREYASPLGFAFRYNPALLDLETDVSEDGQSLMLSAESEELPVYLELITTEGAGASPSAFLEKNGADGSTVHSGTTENGGTLKWFRKAYEQNPEICSIIYAVEDGAHGLSAIATVPAADSEAWEEVFTLLMQTVHFPVQIPLKAAWGKASGQTFIMDKGGKNITLTATEALSQVTLLSLDFAGVTSEGNPLFDTQTVHELDRLLPGEHLTIRLAFPGDIPSFGIRFTDASGTVRQFSIGLSGYDGSLVLEEF